MGGLLKFYAKFKAIEHWNNCQALMELPSEPLSNSPLWNYIIPTQPVEFDDIFSLKQIHSSKVVILDQWIPTDIIHNADGIITSLSDIWLKIHTADCVPLFLNGGNVIGLIHCGWRGLYRGIVGNAIGQMREITGKDIQVFIGPSINEEHYEVGEEFVNYFDFRFLYPKLNGSGYNFDLKGAVQKELIEWGVSRDSIKIFPLSTYDTDGLISYRRLSENLREQMGFYFSMR